MSDTLIWQRLNVVGDWRAETPKGKYTVCSTAGPGGRGGAFPESFAMRSKRDPEARYAHTCPDCGTTREVLWNTHRQIVRRGHARCVSCASRIKGTASAARRFPPELRPERKAGNARKNAERMRQSFRVTCPDCRAERQVRRIAFWQIETGRKTGRCPSCAARASAAARQPTGRSAVPYPLPKPSRRLSFDITEALAAYRGPITVCPVADIREATFLPVPPPSYDWEENGRPVPIVEPAHGW